MLQGYGRPDVTVSPPQGFAVAVSGGERRPVVARAETEKPHDDAAYSGTVGTLSPKVCQPSGTLWWRAYAVADSAATTSATKTTVRAFLMR